MGGGQRDSGELFHCAGEAPDRRRSDQPDRAAPALQQELAAILQPRNRSSKCSRRNAEPRLLCSLPRARGKRAPGRTIESRAKLKFLLDLTQAAGVNFLTTRSVCIPKQPGYKGAFLR